ncbi:hypothetical protein Leryth_023476, partial [Lithospermum erythrorhizon]
TARFRPAVDTGLQISPAIVFLSHLVPKILISYQRFYNAGGSILG